VILLQLKLTKLKLDVLKSDLQQKKKVKNTSTDKLAINWQNCARVRLQLKFAFIIQPLAAVKFSNIFNYSFLAFNKTTKLIRTY